MQKLGEFLSKNKDENKFRLFLDIETFQYNLINGQKKPSEYKNCTYSVAVSFFNDEKLDLSIFPNFFQFFEEIKQACSYRTNHKKRQVKIELIIHNGNKYDNHFMYHDINYYYPYTKIYNKYVSNTDFNEFSKKTKEVKRDEKKNGILLETRIKSANNLELDFWIDEIHFFTTDSLVRTNASIDTLGKKLLNINAITEDELKTSFDYEKYNVSTDLSEDEAHVYALDVFKRLSEKEITYIKNDVIILAQAVKNYEKLFYGFDFEKRTFTSNIAATYNDNPLTNFQLFNQYGKGKEKMKVNLTDYVFNGVNYYDYIRPFYRGGLNFYNHHFLGKILEDCFSMDLNSSYPTVMYLDKIPTYFLRAYGDSNNEFFTKVNTNENIFEFYQMDKETFNNEILGKIRSKIFKQMLVKYFNTNETVNINQLTIVTINKVCHLNINEIKVLSKVTYQTENFGSLAHIEHFYKIKSMGKCKNKMEMIDPLHYTIDTTKKNESNFDDEEIQNAKVCLNGLYGIPALRAYFNIFRRDEETFQLENHVNGFKNNERNIVFSAFVTAKAFYNLVEPFSHLSQKEIDENFVYCDTDSLYFKKQVFEKITKGTKLDPYKLGYWDIEHENIKKMYVLNHKKYTYLCDKQIYIRCGGVPQKSFDRNMTFEKFIETQFSQGCEIKNQKSILNKQGTVSIYPSITLIEKGKTYPSFFRLNEYQRKQRVIQDIRENYIDNGDTLYFETEFGFLSLEEVFKEEESTKNKSDMYLLGLKTKTIKRRIENEIK